MRQVAAARAPDSPCAPDAGPVAVPVCHDQLVGNTPLLFLDTLALFSSSDNKSPEYRVQSPKRLVYCLAVFSADDSAPLCSLLLEKVRSSSWMHGALVGN